MICCLGKSAQEAFDTFTPYHWLLRKYRDASKGACSYDCTVMHCLEGLEFAIKEGWYSIRKFNVKEYDFYSQVKHGDLNWIVPGKFLAFMGPIDRVHGQPKP
jgi:cell division cycle 14